MDDRMKVRSLIARRYLMPKRLSVIAIIGAVSVLGIVIGTAALIIVMSLFNGFRGVARDLMIGFGPHIRILPAQGTTFHSIASVQGALAHALQNTNLKQSALMVAQHSKVVLMAGGRTGVAFAVGAERADHPVLAGAREAVIMGSFRFTTQALPAVVISAGLADQLLLHIGDTVNLLSPRAIEQSLTGLTPPRGSKVIIAGYFQSNAARDVDASRMYMSIEALADVLRGPGQTEIDVLVQNPRSVPAVAQSLQTALQSRLGGTEKIRVLTWEDENRNLVDTMNLERIGSFIVLALIVLVASFNVLVSLTLGVVEKRRDIAVLLAMGLAPADIRTIYLLQGLTLGVVSVLAGVLLGVGLCLGQINYHWISFNMAEGYLVPSLPMEIVVMDVVLVAVVGLALASTAALYPASRAARTNVSDAIRVE